MQTLVSVVIPAYNSAHLIGLTLDSVLAQIHSRLEVVVVDDGSTDHTEAVVRGYGPRVVYVRQENRGLAGARNTGMARATGEVVAWLDADDLWEPEKIALQLEVLRRHPECVMVASDFSAFDETGHLETSHAASYFGAIRDAPGGLAGLFPHRADVETRAHPQLGARLPERIATYRGPAHRTLVFGNFILPSTVVFRREAARRAGVLEARFRRDADWEYLLRVAAQGDVAFVDHPLIRYRYSAGQMSSDRHLADIALSRLLVLHELAGDAALRADPSFRRRLGRSHLAAANALADGRRGEAASHLARSLGFGYADASTLRAAAKLLLPRRFAALLRKRPAP